MASGILRMTDGARRVADLFGDPPRDVPQRPLWGLISFLAFQTLPPTPRRLYQVPEGPARRALRGQPAGCASAAPWPTPHPLRRPRRHGRLAPGGPLRVAGRSGRPLARWLTNDCFCAPDPSAIVAARPRRSRSTGRPSRASAGLGPQRAQVAKDPAGRPSRHLRTQRHHRWRTPPIPDPSSTVSREPTRPPSLHLPAAARMGRARLAAAARLPRRQPDRVGDGPVAAGPHRQEPAPASGRVRRPVPGRPARPRSSATRPSGPPCRCCSRPRCSTPWTSGTCGPTRCATTCCRPSTTATPSGPATPVDPRQPARGRHVGGRGPDPPLPHQGPGRAAAHPPPVLRPLHPHGPGRQLHPQVAKYKFEIKQPARHEQILDYLRRTPASATWSSPAATWPTCPSRSWSSSSRPCSTSTTSATSAWPPRA